MAHYCNFLLNHVFRVIEPLLSSVGVVFVLVSLSVGHFLIGVSSVGFVRLFYCPFLHWLIVRCFYCPIWFLSVGIVQYGYIVRWYTVLSVGILYCPLGYNLGLLSVGIVQFGFIVSLLTVGLLSVGIVQFGFCPLFCIFRLGRRVFLEVVSVFSVWVKCLMKRKQMLDEEKLMFDEEKKHLMKSIR